jgi:hypothetical protein
MANTLDRTRPYSVVSPKEESKVSYSAGSRKKELRGSVSASPKKKSKVSYSAASSKRESKESYSVPTPEGELLEVNKSTYGIHEISTPTNHLLAELQPITKSMDMIERDIPDYPLEPLSPDGNPKRDIRAGILALEESYTKDTSKQESNSGSGLNAVESSVDVKNQKEDPVSVILPPTPSISPSIEETDAPSNKYISHVKKKNKKKQELSPAFPLPETFELPKFDYSTLLTSLIAVVYAHRVPLAYYTHRNLPKTLLIMVSTPPLNFNYKKGFKILMKHKESIH